MLANKIKVLFIGFGFTAAALGALFSPYAALAADNIVDPDHFACYSVGDQIVCDSEGGASAAPAASSSVDESLSEASKFSVVSTTPPQKQSLDPKKISVNSQQWGLSGPVTVDVKYDPELAYIFGLSYLQMLGNAGIKIRLTGGENEFRTNVTMGYGLTPKQQIKITYEYLMQNLPFDFASGQINQWVSQQAFGAAYQYLINHSIFRTFGVDASYVKAGSKNLSGKVYYQGDDAYYNWRRIAGGTERTANTTLELVPFVNTLLKVGAGYSDISYDTQYENQQKNTTVAYEASVEHILTSKTKLGASVQHTAGSTDSAVQVNQILPKKVEATLKGQYSAGALGLENSGSVTLSLSYPAPQQYTFSDTSALAMLKNWIDTPVVSKQRVLAIKDEKSEKYEITADTIANQTVAAGGSIQSINTQNYFKFNTSIYSEVQYTVHAYKYNAQGVVDTNTDYAGALNLAVQSNSNYDATIYSAAPVPANMDANYQVNITAFGYQGGLKAPITATSTFVLTVSTTQQPAPVWKSDPSGQINFNQVVAQPTNQSGNANNGIYLNGLLDGTYTYSNLSFAWQDDKPRDWQITHNGNDWYLSRDTYVVGGKLSVSAADLGSAVMLYINAKNGNSATVLGTLSITVNPSNQAVNLQTNPLPTAGTYAENYQAYPVYQTQTGNDKNNNAAAGYAYTTTRLPDNTLVIIQNDKLSQWTLTSSTDGLKGLSIDGSKTYTSGYGLISGNLSVGEEGDYNLSIGAVSQSSATGASLTSNISLQVDATPMPQWDATQTQSLSIAMDHILTSNAATQGICLDTLLISSTMTPETTFDWLPNSNHKYWQLVSTSGSCKNYLMRAVDNGWVSAEASSNGQPIFVPVQVKNGNISNDQGIYVKVTAATSQVTLAWNNTQNTLPDAFVGVAYPSVTPLYVSTDPFNSTAYQLHTTVLGYPIVDDTLNFTGLNNDVPNGAPAWLSVVNDPNGRGSLVGTTTPSTTGNYSVIVKATSFSGGNQTLQTSQGKPFTVVPAGETPVWKPYPSSSYCSSNYQGGQCFDSLIPFDAIGLPASDELSPPILLNSYLSNAPAGLSFSFGPQSGVLNHGNFTIVKNGNNFYLRRTTIAQNKLDAGDISSGLGNNILSIYAFSGAQQSAAGMFSLAVTGTQASHISYELSSGSLCSISANNASQIYQRQPSTQDPIVQQDLNACVNNIKTYTQVNGAKIEVIKNTVSMATTGSVSWIQGGNMLNIYNPPTPNVTVPVAFNGRSLAVADSSMSLPISGEIPVTALSKILVKVNGATGDVPLVPYPNPTLRVAFETGMPGAYQYTGSTLEGNSNVIGIAICPNGITPPASWVPSDPGQYGCVSTQTVFNQNNSGLPAYAIVTFKPGFDVNAYINSGQGEIQFNKE